LLLIRASGPTDFTIAQRRETAFPSTIMLCTAVHFASILRRRGKLSRATSVAAVPVRFSVTARDYLAEARTTEPYGNEEPADRVRFYWDPYSRRIDVTCVAATARATATARRTDPAVSCGSPRHWKCSGFARRATDRIIG
jgi:hypothetical protein